MTTPHDHPTHRDTGTGWPAEPTRADLADVAPNLSSAEENVPATPARSEPGGAGGADVRRERRFTAAGAVIGLLLGLLGFALVVQLRSNTSDPELAAARPEDLVRILSDLEAREERLRTEIAGLEASQRELASGASGRQAALEEARRRADELGILAGTLPAEGSGMIVRFVPGAKAIQAEAILDAVQELRGAGAEAMQISGAGGAPVRIVASTAFIDVDGGLLVEGQRLTAPYEITVIGDPQTMRTALNIPGGVVESVATDGGSVIVEEPGTVEVDALHEQQSLKYAQPVS
jgi:uncharacterized protein YlxW (UPF0749 family)